MCSHSNFSAENQETERSSGWNKQLKYTTCLVEWEFFFTSAMTSLVLDTPPSVIRSSFKESEITFNATTMAHKTVCAANWWCQLPG